MFRALILIAIIAAVAAFAPVRNFGRVNTRSMEVKMVAPTPGSSYWEGSAPPSSVLGVGAKIPSSIFGPLSLVALAVGTYCCHESNILNQITVTTIYPGYVAGSLLVPISWGMHVAAWIQKQNGM